MFENKVVKPTETASSAARLKNKYPVAQPSMKMKVAGI